MLVDLITFFLHSRLATNESNYFFVWAMCLADSRAWTPTAALKIHVEREI